MTEALFPLKVYIFIEPDRHGAPFDIVSEAQLHGPGIRTLVFDAIEQGWEIVITDPADQCVFHVKDHQLLFPPKEAL